MSACSAWRASGAAGARLAAHAGGAGGRGRQGGGDPAGPALDLGGPVVDRVEVRHRGEGLRVDEPLQLLEVVGGVVAEPLDVDDQVVGEGTGDVLGHLGEEEGWVLDRKSTRLNSSHVASSPAGSCLKRRV